MTKTDNFNITLIEQSQSQKEVTANQAFVDIDGLLSTSVIERDSGEYWYKNRLEVSQIGLSGGTVTTALQIPDRALVFGIHTLVTTAITGATDFDIGIAGDTALFGDTIGIANDATNIGIITPRPFFANTDVILTANGSNFTGGDVLLVMHYMTFRGAWNF